MIRIRSQHFTDSDPESCNGYKLSRLKTLKTHLSVFQKTKYRLNDLARGGKRAKLNKLDECQASKLKKLGKSL